MALRQQLAIYQRTVKRPRIRPTDRMLWSWLSRRWAAWREALAFVQPATVIAWQRRRFCDHWARMSQAGKRGRPPISTEVREFIRKMSGANPLWGTPASLASWQSSASRWRSQRWTSTVSAPASRLRRRGSRFLKNHITDLASIDFFVVPTIRFKLLFVLVVLAHSRRQVIHFNVTEHPSAQWTGQQIVEAFPWDGTPSYLLRDRPSTAAHFSAGSRAWGSSRSSAHREVRGRTHSWSGSSEPCVASASIMSSF